MGEEEKKAEEVKTEEKKEEAKPAEEKKEDDKEAPPPPQEVVLRVYMHCEGCASKVRRCLKDFDGVEDVVTDCRSSMVIVKGEKAAADPVKVLNRVQRKSHRQVELISPIPKPPEPKEEEKPKPEEKKEEPPKVIVVVIKVHMHCEACAQEIKKRIQRMKGVESAEADLKSSEVSVKGVFDPSKLIEYVYKRTGKHAAIVKQEPEPMEKKEEAEKPKDEAPPAEEKKTEEPANDGGDGDKKGEEEKKEGGEEEGGEEETEETKVMELKRNEYYYNPPRYAMELYAYPPPPQIFSDENPNACSLM